MNENESNDNNENGNNANGNNANGNNANGNNTNGNNANGNTENGNYENSETNENEKLKRDEEKRRKFFLNEFKYNYKYTFIDWASGTLGGAAETYVVQPFDTIKVKRQTYPFIYRNSFDCFRKTLRYEGLYRGLYAGTVPALVCNVLENATLFTTYGSIQHFVAHAMNIENTHELPILSDAIAGAISGIPISIFATPLELLKCKLQARQERIRLTAGNLKKLSPLQLAVNIYQNRGILGFYKGYVATLARDIPGYFLFFGGYRWTSIYLEGPNAIPGELNPITTLTAGAIAGTLLWGVTFPIDVVKSRIQINNLKGRLIKITIDVFKEEGLKGLYHGFWLTMLRAIPSSAVLFTVVEYSKSALFNFFDDYM